MTNRLLVLAGVAAGLTIGAWVEAQASGLEEWDDPQVTPPPCISWFGIAPCHEPTPHGHDWSEPRETDPREAPEQEPNRETPEPEVDC